MLLSDMRDHHLDLPEIFLDRYTLLGCSPDKDGFLDGLATSVDSGNLLERRLTIADMAITQ
jgi:hypothetical protein